MKYLTVIVLFCCASCANMDSLQDDEKIMSYLLNIKNENNYTEQNAELNSNSEKAYQDITQHYSELYQASSKKGADPHVVKKLLLIGFAAYHNTDAATRQALSRDLMTVYDNNRPQVLSALTQVNYLIEPSCYYLNNYFDMNAKRRDKKEAFLTVNKPLMTRAFSRAQAQRCFKVLRY